MRYLIVFVCLVVFSCKNTSEKKELDHKESLSIEAQNSPNIFVVKTTIYAKDSLPITADIYEVNNKKATVLLCHQAGYSRGEYKDTAIKLNHLGYSCMAIDQRSGNEVNNVKNETAAKAKEKNLPMHYLDARQDIEAAIDYLYEQNGQQPIILIGSSYAATLALLIGNSSEKVKAIAAFSPGEYFKTIQVKEAIKNISKPVFVTASKKETPALEILVSLVDQDFVTHYKPEVEGIHGSRVLWDATEGNEAYWEAFTSFLEKQ